jgi:hypothetical protein
MQIITDIAEITSLIREADEIFETVGGSTRHYVRDVLLPLMEEKGIYFCRNRAPESQIAQR